MATESDKEKRFWPKNGSGQSPRAQLAKMFPHSVDPSTRRKLLLQASIIEELKTKYKNTRRERERQIIAKATTGKIIKNIGYRGLLRRPLDILRREQDCKVTSPCFSGQQGTEQLQERRWYHSS